ncbi:MAG: hypothetical protein ACTIJ9_13895 [Aequorivita sp.]
MTRQIDNENTDNKTSVLETQDSTSTSKNTTRETDSEPVLKAEVEEKKSFSERWETNRFWLVRGTYHVLRSVWMVVMFIGGLIAWLISLLFI